MRRIALSAAVMSFFVLAGIGWASGVPVFVCSMRALAGAVCLYVLLSLAAAAAIRIIADTTANTELDEMSPGNGRP